MKPLPVQRGSEPDTSAKSPASLPNLLSSDSSAYSNVKRRVSANPTQRIYPWLLSISTLTAGAFCLLYITKPVIVNGSNSPSVAVKEIPPITSAQSAVPGSSGLMPNKNRLPGEQPFIANKEKSTCERPSKSLPPPILAQFEETNLRIQHILTAEAPGDHLDRIDVDVPVLYQSRNLRWTANEVAEARLLLGRLVDYQKKTIELRSVGFELLNSWNRLVESSIPATELRADSPTLPSNQIDAADTPRCVRFDYHRVDSNQTLRKMKRSLLIILACLLGLTNTQAQNLVPRPVADPVFDSIEILDSKSSKKTNEVTVVLPPMDQESSPLGDDEKKDEKASIDSTKKPIQVTGTRPKDSELVVDEPKIAMSPEEVAKHGKKTTEGPNVRVEKVKAGKGSIDPSQVKLLAPFPAKPLAPAPAGWRLQSSNQVPPFIRDVELSPGKKITLTIRPHLLVPDADGNNVFNVMEPGFEVSLGYQQLQTVGAILSTSTSQLEKDSKQMALAIDQLQQLLGSLPKAEAIVTPAPKAISKNPEP